MAGLVPAIRVLLAYEEKTWMPGTRPGMTEDRSSSKAVEFVPSAAARGANQRIDPVAGRLLQIDHRSPLDVFGHVGNFKAELEIADLGSAPLE